MNDHELELALEAMGRDRTTLIEPPALRERVMAVPITAHQPNRWLPHFDPRRSTMFSALKFIAAGALVALFGGLLLAGVLPAQHADEIVPAAVSASPATTQADTVSRDAAIVNGGVVGGIQTDTATITRDGNATRSLGAQWQMELTDMDDARLNGTFQVKWNEVVYDGVFNVATATGRIDNQHGSWIGVERGYRHPIRGWHWQGLYEGEGAYEGLSALLFWEQASSNVAHGIVFPGEMPEPLDAPEAVAITE